MTKERDIILRIVDSISYKPGWSLHCGNDGRQFICWKFSSPDYTTPGMPVKPWNSRKWYLSDHMVEGEIVQTALAAAVMAEEHEAREAFTYCGVRVFNPHISIDALMILAQQTETRDMGSKAVAP